MLMSWIRLPCASARQGRGKAESGWASPLVGWQGMRSHGHGCNTSVALSGLLMAFEWISDVADQKVHVASTCGIPQESTQWPNNFAGRWQEIRCRMERARPMRCTSRSSGGRLRGHRRRHDTLRPGMVLPAPTESGSTPPEKAEHLDRGITAREGEKPPCRAQREDKATLLRQRPPKNSRPSPSRRRRCWRRVRGEGLTSVCGERGRRRRGTRGRSSAA